MARVFISYARQDKPAVELLADGLKLAGHEVWWDADLGAGQTFRAAIESQIARAHVVVVVWSPRAAASRYVLDEADLAIARNVFLPVRLNGSPPLGFGPFHAIDLADWTGDYDCVEWRTLLREVARIAATPAPPPSRLPLQIWPGTLTVAGTWGLLIGFTLWGFYSVGNQAVKSSILGHPLIDSIALGLALAAPIALCAAIETRRRGFERTSLIARRSLVWLAYGGGIALLIVALAVAAGALPASDPGEIIAQLARAIVVTAIASASLLTSAKLGMYLVRRLLGRPGAI